MVIAKPSTLLVLPATSFRFTPSTLLPWFIFSSASYPMDRLILHLNSTTALQTTEDTLRKTRGSPRLDRSSLADTRNFRLKQPWTKDKLMFLKDNTGTNVWTGFNRFSKLENRCLDRQFS